jgi:hypothetical protein
MDATTLAQARATAQTIVERVQTDPAFATQIRQDPEGTLRAAGMPEAALGPALHEMGVAEVAGYQMGGEAGMDGGLILGVTHLNWCPTTNG